MQTKSNESHNAEIYADVFVCLFVNLLSKLPPPTVGMVQSV